MSVLFPMASIFFESCSKRCVLTVKWLYFGKTYWKLFGFSLLWVCLLPFYSNTKNGDRASLKGTREFSVLFTMASMFFESCSKRCVLTVKWLYFGKTTTKRFGFSLVWVCLLPFYSNTKNGDRASLKGTREFSVLFTMASYFFESCSKLCVLTVKWLYFGKTYSKLCVLAKMVFLGIAGKNSRFCQNS